MRWEGVGLAWTEAELALSNELFVNEIMIEIVLSGNRDAHEIDRYKLYICINLC